MHAGIDAVMPERLFGRPAFSFHGSEPDAHESGLLRVVAVGKASPAMVQAALGHLGRRDLTGLVIAPAPAPIDGRLEMIVAHHPVPDRTSESAGRRALQLAESCGADQTLLLLISGGASALMAVPADGITLDDKRQTTTRLLESGADIHALNCVRKHLSSIKGGWLAARCPGRTIAFAISDVVGDDLSVIGSGPTVPDPSTYADALDVMRRFGGPGCYPSPVVRHLERGAAGDLPETPKPRDARLARATTSIVGSRRDAMAGAATEAAARGYHAVTLDPPVVGEARDAAGKHIRSALDAVGARPACIISSGETTVRVTGRGRGGRNQEFALAGAVALAQLGAAALLASVGTDGVDGPTDAAGAIADQTTTRRASAAGLAPPGQVLADNDSYSFFAALGDLIHTGPTGTNVGDLQIFLLA